MAAGLSASPPAQTQTTTKTAPATASAPALPQTPGHHRLFFKTRLDNTDVRLAYAIYLPRNYDGRRDFPMVTFLNGAGEVGNNHEALYNHGPVAEIKRNPDLAQWADFIVLCPQCPGNMRWDFPGLARSVIDLIEFVKSSWRVDADRVYLTGLSMGGAGTWIVALEGPHTFAAIAPISAIEIAPQKMAQAMKNTTVWIICGANDGGYTTGSRNMAKILSAAKVDVVLTEVPNADHGVWAAYYANKLFYEFLLLHRRGQPPPPSRPIREQLLAIAYTYPNSTDAALAAPFKKFLPYWYLLNCGREGKPGLKDELGGRKGVFVTSPLEMGIPCRLLTTFSIPTDKKSTLELVVGHLPNAPWRLRVRGNGQELFEASVGSLASTQSSTRPATAAAATTKPATRGATGPATQPAVTWQDVSVDLSGFAGQEVRVELLDEAVAKSPSAACWGQAQLVSVDLPKPPPPPEAPAAPTWAVVAACSAAALLAAALLWVRHRTRRQGRPNVKP